MKCSIMLHFIWVFTVCQITGFPLYKCYNNHNGLVNILVWYKCTCSFIGIPRQSMRVFRARFLVNTFMLNTEANFLVFPGHS